MIKFVHKKHFTKVKGTAKIIITYSAFDIILGIFLLVTNIIVIMTLYHYQNPSYKNGMMNSQVPYPLRLQTSHSRL